MLADPAILVPRKRRIGELCGSRRRSFTLTQVLPRRQPAAKLGSQ
jgi:hypothetical protein